MDVAAPWPGIVQEVMVAVGDSVQEEDELLALESMKMINPVTAPAAGRVTAIHVAIGDIVAAGAPLVTLER
ncbi:MAG: acetyl-CoA carboxylase biotin carboxyl carrier protein subunit [Chloroflexi bacterium]|nr:acetyl-CoA carboxylase biotin carboxyl carrier protein subunit [Chloroflexota bacterium]MDA1241323.1 acetyl-CoA carboxylase biotin carboxyl carrier protein subunit [Chloroflexota bacterium]